MTGVAVKFTVAPAQMEVDDAVMLTEGVTEFVVIVTSLEVAVGAVAQDALEVITTRTASPLFKVLDENTALVAPGTLAPLTCH